METDPEISKLKELQDLLGGYTDYAIQQMKTLPALVFDNAKSYSIELSENQITVNLKRYRGLKGLYFKFKRNTDADKAQILSKYIAYWIPKNLKPKIIIQWVK